MPKVPKIEKRLSVHGARFTAQGKKKFIGLRNGVRLKAHGARLTAHGKRKLIGLKNGARQTAQGTRRTVKYEDAKLPFLPQTHADLREARMLVGAAVRPRLPPSRGDSVLVDRNLV
jgi:hypothetical protein